MVAINGEVLRAGVTPPTRARENARRTAAQNPPRARSLVSQTLSPHGFLRRKRESSPCAGRSWPGRIPCVGDVGSACDAQRHDRRPRGCVHQLAASWSGGAPLGRYPCARREAVRIRDQATAGEPLAPRRCPTAGWGRQATPPSRPSPTDRARRSGQGRWARGLSRPSRTPAEQRIKVSRRHGLAVENRRGGSFSLPHWPFRAHNRWS